jgi:hypothetical protein
MNIIERIKDFTHDTHKRSGLIYFKIELKSSKELINSASHQGFQLDMKKMLKIQ